MRLYQMVDGGGQPNTEAVEHDPVPDEATLESILHAAPQLIADEPLLVIGRQVHLKAGVPDLVACDQFGNVVVCEVKSGLSGTASASEETILSQPLVYAGAVATFDYDDLNDVYADYRERLANGEWSVDPSNEPSGSLQEAVETTFGQELAPHEFNTEQRIVIVAEEITDATARNTRYLLDSDMHYQCTEVKRFRIGNAPSENQFVATKTVVDYDLSRVRPPNRPSPTYPDLIAEIVTQAFPNIRDTVRAETVADVFPDGFDTRGAELVSQHPRHPDEVIYYISPEPDANRVTMGIHNMNETPSVNERIHDEVDRFTEAGLTVKDNPRYNVVWRRWSVDSVADVRALQPEISDQYETMVWLGHEVLTDQTEKSDEKQT